METPPPPDRSLSPPRENLALKARLNPNNQHILVNSVSFYTMSGKKVELAREPASIDDAHGLIKNALSLPFNMDIVLFEKDSMKKIEDVLLVDEVWIVVIEK